MSIKNLYLFLFCIGFIYLTSCDNDNESIETDSEEPFLYEFSKAQFVHSINNTIIPYHFFSPQQALNSKEKFPLILSLHGAENAGVSPEDFLTRAPYNYMAVAWIEKETQREYPAYVVAPHLTDKLILKTEYGPWTGNNMQHAINELLDYLIKKHAIDRTRIYVVGHSIGGRAVWLLNKTLKDRVAAIVPLSHALGHTENAAPIIEDISRGNYDNLPIWNFVHRKDIEGSVKTSRPIFNHFRTLGYEPVITHTLGSDIFNLTNEEIDSYINNGKKYFYTEYDGSCGIENPGCHYAMLTALKDPLVLKWVFKQKRNEL